MPSELIPFCAVAVLFSLSPGPDTVLVVNRAVGHGRRAALLTALGCASGLLFWGIASAIGIAAVVGASATAFTVLKLAGAAYLIVLGLLAIRRARRDAAEQLPAASRSTSPATATGRRPPRWAYGQGLLTNLLNPKAGVFFVAVLPQFVGPGENVLATTVIFAAVDAVISLLALVLYGTLALGAGSLLRRPAARRALDRVTGAILVAFGVRLAATAR